MKKWGLVLVLILGLNIAFVKEVKADCTMPVRADFNGDGIVGLTETKTIYRAEGHSVCSFDAPTAKINVTNDYTVCSQETFTPDESGVTGKEYLYTCTSSGFQKQTHLWTSKSCGGTLGLSGTACINNISTTDFADAENDAGCMSSPTCTSYDGTKIDSEDWGCYNETSYARCWRGKFVCIQTCNNGKCKLKNDSVYRYKCYDQPCPDYGISSGENTCAKDNTGALRVVVKCVDGEVSKTTCESNELCVEKDGISSCTSTLTNNLCTQDEDGNEMSAAVTNGDTVCYNNKISVCTTVPKIETVKDGDCTSKQETCYNTKETGFVPKCLTKDGAEGLGINTSVTVDISTDTGFMCDVNSSINSDSEGGSGDDNDGVSTAFGCIPITASGLANKLLPILFGIAGGISFLRMVLGFIMIATSSGDEKKFIEAKSVISSAIIGLLVSIFAIFLFRLIFVNILQIPGLSEKVMILSLIKPVYAEDAIIPTYDNVDFKYKDILGSQYTVGEILSDLLPYIYVMAGLVLLLLLITGGFSLMTSAGNPDKIKAGYGKIKSALIGFLIIFVSYIVVLLVQTILGVDIGFGQGDSLF